MTRCARSIACGLMAAAIVSCAPTAWSQRVQFPSFDAGASPPAATPYRPPPVTGGATTGSSPPPATFGGRVEPAPAWDPYTNPNTSTAPGSTPYYVQPPAGDAGQPPYLFPEGLPWGSNQGGSVLGQPGGATTRFQRFLDELRSEFTWLAPIGGETEFGMSTLELYSTFALPVFYNTESPLLITPGFAARWLEGPQDPADLPPRLYDAYLDAAWKPRVTPWLSGDLGVRVGVYSDFGNVSTDALRLMGRGLGVLRLTPTTQIALGAVYLDRIPVKVLPAGGIIWTPTPDRRYEIVFPNPRLAKRLIDIGTTEWWCYVAGEYGGGRWAVERIGDVEDDFGYNDIRVIGGLEWTALSGMSGFFEVGYVFDREIIFQNSPFQFDPDDTIMVRGGLSF